MSEQLLAPFPFFGGKRCVVGMIWRRFGTPKQYIEPFCGSAAVLLAAHLPELSSGAAVDDGFGPRAGTSARVEGRRLRGHERYGKGAGAWTGSGSSRTW